MIGPIILILMVFSSINFSKEWKKGHREFWKLLWNSFKSPFILSALVWFTFNQVVLIYDLYTILELSGKGYLVSSVWLQVPMFILILGAFLIGIYFIFKDLPYKTTPKTKTSKEKTR